jgi:DNA-binding response OmpR family regulator
VSIQRKRILVIDEDPDLLQYVAKRCRTLGMEVDTAEEAVAAMTLFERQPPDLLLLDGLLPGGSGLRLSEMVLASPDDVTCPVIIMTREGYAVEKNASTDMCVYRVRKRAPLWQFLEPIIRELVDVDPQSRRSNDEEEDKSECCS